MASYLRAQHNYDEMLAIFCKRPKRLTPIKASVTELPFNSFLGIQIATEASQFLRLPSGDQYLNPVGNEQRVIQSPTIGR